MKTMAARAELGCATHLQQTALLKGTGLDRLHGQRGEHRLCTMVGGTWTAWQTTHCTLFVSMHGDKARIDCRPAAA